MTTAITNEFTGALAERVAIETRTGAGDAWQAIAMRAAAVVPDAPDGGPVLAGEALVARLRWRLTLRADASITLAARLRWRGRALRILRCLADPRTPDRLTILAEECE
jgi:head-tail adaptor